MRKRQLADALGKIKGKQAYITLYNRTRESTISKHGIKKPKTTSPTVKVYLLV